MKPDNRFEKKKRAAYFVQMPDVRYGREVYFDTYEDAIKAAIFLQKFGQKAFVVDNETGEILAEFN